MAEPTGLAEFVREIERLTQAALRTTFVQAPGEPKHVYYELGPGGRCEWREADREPLAVQLATPAAFVEYVKSHNQGDSPGGEVYFDETALVFVHNDTVRRDRAFCKLAPSPQLTLLHKLATSLALYPQRDFVRLLRIDLAGCFSGQSNLLPLVRNLKWTGANEANLAVQHGKESIGRAITAQVSGADAIPEEVTLFVPIWENHDARQFVRCAVEIAPQEQSFRLTPYPLQIREALDGSLRDLRVLLDACEPCPRFHGKP